MSLYLARLALAAGFFTVSPAQAAPAPDPNAYPELRSEVLLPQILEGLRNSLPDPYSVRDLVVCPPEKIRFRNGRPVGWTVSLSLNSRGEAGGYTGMRTYAAIFRNGRLSGEVLLTTLPGKDGFDGMFNRMIERRMAGCPRVPNAQVQAYFEGEAGLGG